MADLKAFRPTDAMPYEWAFRGIVPWVSTFKKDLKAAGIPFEHVRGRRMDIAPCGNFSALGWRSMAWIYRSEWS